MKLDAIEVWGASLTTHRNKKLGRWWKDDPPGPIISTRWGDIVCSDAMFFLQALREDHADIIFLDPPFNLGKRYGSGDKSSDSVDECEYFYYMMRILNRCSELLKPGGALYLYHIPRWASRFSAVLDQRLDFRHWISISMKNGFPARGRLYPAHYALLYYTKGKPQHFTRPKLPIQKCPHCGKPTKSYGGYRKFLNAGINLSDFWEDISPVRHKKLKHRPANELPLEIPMRVVDISGVPGGILIDPFAGSGTALVAAKKKGMRFVGCDVEQEYCRLMESRIKDA